MNIIKVWDIQVWDGGDRHHHKYYVSNKETADIWMERHPQDWVSEFELTMFDTIEQLDDIISGETRKRALAKLTKEDKIALGIKD